MTIEEFSYKRVAALLASMVQEDATFERRVQTILASSGCTDIAETWARIVAAHKIDLIDKQP